MTSSASPSPLLDATDRGYNREIDPGNNDKGERPMSNENRNYLVEGIGALAGIGLLAVGGATLLYGLQGPHYDSLSELAKVACFAVSAVAFSIVFRTVLRK